MSQRAEKYARNMERRVDKLEDQAGRLEESRDKIGRKLGEYGRRLTMIESDISRAAALHDNEVEVRRRGEVHAVLRPLALHPGGAVQSQLCRLVHNICGTLLFYDHFHLTFHRLLQLRLPGPDRGHIALQPSLSALHVQAGNGGQYGPHQHQSAHQPPHSLHRPGGHQGVGRCAQHRHRDHRQQPSSHCFHHGVTAPTADTRLISSTSAPAPVIPSTRPKAEPMASISPDSPG